MLGQILVGSSNQLVMQAYDFTAFDILSFDFEQQTHARWSADKVYIMIRGTMMIATAFY